ncbi:hypothetical protein QYE76_028335 [Lolium multiflorum]|uniref:Transposase (putative) gypsy type domain-containing protein n=1 Tax=Lolium multiflorum TaxID=4521 RepID=A0AAD8QNK0_LOLMU|nr:hypothetical protein QYE76_028335 [Lolium multiflorum]
MSSSSSLGVASATNPDAAAVMPSRLRTGRGRREATRPEDFASFLRTQDEIDALCNDHGVPKEFTARPAGDLRANATPPPGAICVYAPALEAGLRVPLHGFVREALAHFGIAPAQLTPNGWRMMAGFLALCRSDGVPPSLAVFRYFFQLSVVCKSQNKGWYCFRSRDSSGLRFTGMPAQSYISVKHWKSETFLNPAAAMTATAFAVQPAPPRPTSSTTCIVSRAEGMDPFVHAMVKTMLAEKAAAQASASAKKVKAEPGSKVAGSPPLCGKKRSLEEAKDKEYSPPPGFSRKPRRFPSTHDGDGTDWVATREQVASAKRDAEGKAMVELAATRAELAKAKARLAEAEAEVVNAKAELTAAKARPELAVEGAQARLAAAKRALEEELESVKAAAVHQLLCCEEHVRRRAEHALEGYQRWRTARAPAARVAWLAR